MEKNLIITTTPISSINKLKCEKCRLIPEFTIFNSSNRVKIFSSCDNKHLNI